jgi:hypothetical protein
MTIFLENIWIWGVIAFIIIACGFYIFVVRQQLKPFLITAAVAVVVLLLGIVIVLCVPTNRKSIITVLDGLINNIETNNIDGVHGFILPEAIVIRSLATRGLQKCDVNRARYSDLKIDFNYITSPPTADVSFTGTFHWRFRDNPEAHAYYPARVKIILQFEQTENGWQINDNFRTEGLGNFL